MFGRKMAEVEPESVENIVWLRLKGNDKHRLMQWMALDFMEPWLECMKKSFDIFGMVDTDALPKRLANRLRRKNRVRWDYSL